MTIDRDARTLAAVIERVGRVATMPAVMLTTDRAAGVVLVLLGLFVMEESWRLRLPLGTLRNPGPAFMPAALGLLVLAFGFVVALGGMRAPRLAALGWHEWRHAVAIFAACAFAAWALERLGYRLTVAAVLVFLVGVVERRGIVATAVMAGVLSAGSFYLFNNVLRVPLPRGPFGL